MQLAGVEHITTYGIPISKFAMHETADEKASVTREPYQPYNDHRSPCGTPPIKPRRGCGSRQNTSPSIRVDATISSV